MTQNGVFMKKFMAVGIACVLSVGFSSAFTITPNPIVSSGALAYTNGSTSTYLTDGNLLNWKSVNAKDIAIQVASGPSKLFIHWESFGDCAWATDFTTGCGHSGTAFKNFKIMTSANSTNGQDGDWEEALEIIDNPVMARGVTIDFTGKSWFRMVSEEDSGALLEIEAFDVSEGGNDTWFFMGTSISQMGIKQQDDDLSKATADWIHEKYPQYTPAMLRGGIGCINSTEVVAHLEEYLAYAGNVQFWAIEMGTNDAWGGGDWNLETFRKNMQTIIDSAKAHNIVPILARIIATDSSKATWQINPKFLEAIDSLTTQNNLPPGPDFYTYFREHPELLGSDGVHPNAETGGGHMMHQLWAEALYPLYENGWDNGEEQKIAIKNTHSKVPQIYVQGKTIMIAGVVEPESKVMLMNAIGQVLETHKIKSPENSQFTTNAPKGNYFIVIRGQSNAITTKVMIK